MMSEMDIFGMFDNKKLTACLILLVLELFIDGKFNSLNYQKKLNFRLNPFF